MNSGIFFKRFIINNGQAKVITQDSNTISNRFATRRKRQWFQKGGLKT